MTRINFLKRMVSEGCLVWGEQIEAERIRETGVQYRWIVYLSCSIPDVVIFAVPSDSTVGWL